MNKQAILDSLNIPAFYASEFSGLQWSGSDTTKALCPFHDDHEPSLSLNKHTGAFNCFSCGAKGSLFDFYMKKYGLNFSESMALMAERAGIITNSKAPERIHTYNDEAGKPVYRKLIFKAGDKKSASFERYEGGAWLKGLQGKPQTLYNLHRLKGDTGSVVFLSESEKDADNLTGLNLLAVTSGGAESWRPEYVELLKGCQVCILPHNDAVGKKYAETAAKSLSGKAASIRIVDPETFGSAKGADVSDWLQVGGTKEKLLELVKEASEYDVSSFLDIGGGHLDTWLAEPFSYLKRGADLRTLDIKIEWLIDKLLPKESITLLHGKGGIGKTWVCLILADCISRGLPFMGLDTQTLPVIFVDFENSLPVLCDRVKKIGIDDVLFWHNSDMELKPPKLDNEGWEQYKALPPGSLLIFDTLRASQGQDENDSRHMAGIMSKLKELRDMGFTILLLHHTPKGNDRTYKGSTAILDLADHVLSLHKVKKGNPEGGEVEDEDDMDCLYRLGTKDKTRYEPFHVFMSFDKVKGFVKAEDPAEDDLREIYNILKEHPRLNQKAIFESAKTELDIKSKGKVINLLRKGEGKYWTSCREGKAIFYEALGCVHVSTPIYSQPGHINNGIKDVSRTERTDAFFDNTQTLDTSHVSMCPPPISKKLDTSIIDLEFAEILPC